MGFFIYCQASRDLWRRSRSRWSWHDFAYTQVVDRTFVGDTATAGSQLGSHGVGVQLANPFGNNQGRNSVTDQVGQGAGFGHEAVDTQDQRQTGNWQVANSRQGGSQYDEAATGHASSTFGRQQQHQQQGDLVGDVHVGVSRLGDEHGSHGQVDRSTVQVEGVASRDNQADYRLFGAQAFHFDQHAWQCGFGRGSTQYDQQFFTDVADQFQDAEAVSAADATQHDQHEQDAGDVEADHQLTELHQRTYTVGTDGERHGAQGTQWRELHDHVDDVEHHVREAIDEVQHRLAVGTQAVQGETEDHREHQHLQDIAVGESADDGVRDHVKDEANHALVCTGSHVGRDFGGVQGSHVDVHAGARLHDVNHDQTDQQGDGGNNFEVQQRVATGFANRFHALHASDAADNGAEDDRGDDHFDQLDEAVTQWLERHAGLRVEVTEQNTDNDCNDHLEIQGFVQWLTSRHCKVPQSHRVANIRHCPRHLNCEPSCTGGICCLRGPLKPACAVLCIANAVPHRLKTLKAFRHQGWGHDDG